LTDSASAEPGGGRASYSYHWELYGRTQKRYDPFNDEWDLCSEFDPDGEASDDGFDDDDDVLMPYEQTLPDVSDVTVAQSSLQHLLRMDKDVDVTPNDLSFPYHNETSLTIAYYRWGFAGDATSGSVKSEDWIDCVRAFGGTDILEDTTSRTQSHVCNFMASISSKTPSPSVLDLKLRNSHINNLILRRFLLHRIITEGSITYFVLQCITADGAFDVALVNPVDVCEIFRRRWGPSLALVKELAARGIEFIVCSRRPANAPF
jgi:hypothetical protein